MFQTTPLPIPVGQPWASIDRDVEGQWTHMSHIGDKRIPQLPNNGHYRTSYMPMLGEGIRVGPGLGASGGLVVVLAMNLPDLSKALGLTSGQFDFPLVVGGKWSGLLKGLRGRVARIDSAGAIEEDSDRSRGSER